MVSVVRPQKGRICYACMDGTDLVIRQSKLYGLEKRNDQTLDLFASILLSEPLDEVPKLKPSILPEGSWDLRSRKGHKISPGHL